MKTRLPTKIYNIVLKLLDFIFPPRNNSKNISLHKGNASKSNTKTLLKDAHAINWKRLYSNNPYSYVYLNKYCLLPYSNKTIKSLTWKFKYDRDTYATNFFADIMTDELISLFSDTLNMRPASIPTLITYCPSSSYISGKKSWDHMKDLVLLIERRCVSFQPHLAICIDALEITASQKSASDRDTKEQHTGTRKERLAWAKNKYRLSSNFEKYLRFVQQIKREIHIICIDDIFTTGATIEAATAAFKPIQTHKTTALTLCFTEYSSEA